MNALRSRNIRIVEGRQAGGLEGYIADHRYLQDVSGSTGTVGGDILRDGLPVNLGDLLGSKFHEVGGSML